MAIDNTQFILKVIHSMPPFLKTLKGSYLVQLSKGESLVYSDVVNAVCRM